jgi:hypothetical protein
VPEKRPTVPEVTEHPTLTDALAAVQRELPKVAKGETATVPTKAGGTYSYSYTSLADLSLAVLPLLGRHGLAWTCLPHLTDAGAFVLTWQLRHASEVLEGTWPLPAAQAGPQAQGSAITYARRYCLLAVTGVAPDDEDDDGAVAQAAATQPRASKRSSKASSSSKAEGGARLCARCGKSLAGATVKRSAEGLVHREGCDGPGEDSPPEQQPTEPEQQAEAPQAAPEPATGELPTSLAELGELAVDALSELHGLTRGRQPYGDTLRMLREDLGGGDPREVAAWQAAEDGDLPEAVRAEVRTTVAALLAEVRERQQAD